MNHVTGDIRGTSDECLKAQQANAANMGTPYGGACCGQKSTDQRPTTRAESIMIDLSYQASRAQDETARALAALEFFERHPEFAEFIGLIRSGAILI